MGYYRYSVMRVIGLQVATQEVGGYQQSHSETNSSASAVCTPS